MRTAALPGRVRRAFSCNSHPPPSQTERPLRPGTRQQKKSAARQNVANNSYLRSTKHGSMKKAMFILLAALACIPAAGLGQ
ncbi:MAG: hypothetical protein K2J53_02625, partial [Alistipes sp.]|nr:hypothetical protein [Alistipes sp.]